MKTNRLSRLLGTTAILLVPLAFLPSPSAAQEEESDDFSLDLSETPEETKPVYTSEVEIGLGWVSDDSAEFGKFSGLDTEGAFVVGNVNVLYRNADGDRPNAYFILNGTDLGLDSRSLYAEYGWQGHARAFLFYDAIPRYLHDDAQTPFIFSNHGTVLDLPAGWVPGDRNISQMTELDASLHDFNVRHVREKVGGGLSLLPSKHWSLTSSFNHEKKKGTRTIAAIFGSSGGNPAGMIVPEPVDYETDTFDVAIQYGDKVMNAALSYNLSLFRNNNDSLLFQNPYTAGAWEASANYPDGYGRMALPPDNWAHRITFAGNYILSPMTRATANISFVQMGQDDDFLPYSVDAALAPTALPRQSLDGKIDTWRAAFGLSSRLSPDFTFRASYRYENRDNKTPRDVFLVVPGDVEAQGTIFDDTARVNWPYSRTQNRAELEGAYRVGRSSKITIAYNYESLERTFTEVTKTKEHKVRGKFQTSPSVRSSAWVGVEYGSRTGSDYVFNRPLLTTLTPEHLGPNAEDEYENHFLMRKYYIADRDELKVNGAANWTPRDDLTLSLSGRYQDDDYNETILGLTASKLLSVTGDMNYQPEEGLDLHLFYTFDRSGYDQTNISWNSRTPDAERIDLGLRGWNIDTKDAAHTFGAGLDWAAVKDELDLNLDYYFSDATTTHDLSAGTAIGFAPFPDQDSRLHKFDALAKYQFTDQLAFNLRYVYAHYDSTDFALDGIAPDAMNFVIGLGDQAPNYDVHVIRISTAYAF